MESIVMLSAPLTRILLHKTLIIEKLWWNLETLLSIILPLTLPLEKFFFFVANVLCNIAPGGLMLQS